MASSLGDTSTSHMTSRLFGPLGLQGCEVRRRTILPVRPKPLILPSLDLGISLPFLGFLCRNIDVGEYYQCIRDLVVMLLC